MSAPLPPAVRTVRQQLDARERDRDLGLFARGLRWASAEVGLYVPYRPTLIILVFQFLHFWLGFIEPAFVDVGSSVFLFFFPGFMYPWMCSWFISDSARCEELVHEPALAYMYHLLAVTNVMFGLFQMIVMMHVFYRPRIFVPLVVLEIIGDWWPMFGYGSHGFMLMTPVGKAAQSINFTITSFRIAWFVLFCYLFMRERSEYYIRKPQNDGDGKDGETEQFLEEP